MDRLLRPVIIRTSSSPARVASSTTYWMAGLSTTGSISLGVALVAGRNRVPIPAAGITALVMQHGAGRDERGCPVEVVEVVGVVEVMLQTVVGHLLALGDLAVHRPGQGR